MKLSHKSRRALIVLIFTGLTSLWLYYNPKSYDTEIVASETPTVIDPEAPLATVILEKLNVKGRAPKTGYARTEFYKTWPTMDDGCNLRQKIIKRDFGDTAQFSEADKCTVLGGEYDEPYTGKHQIFTEHSQISKGVQIDHVVALSDAWQKGAQLLSKEERYRLATDELNLLATDASANMQKSDSDAASWLPKNKKFRCAYVARQISVKHKYHLWVTSAEKDAMKSVLSKCPSEPAVGVTLVGSDSRILGH